MLSVPMKVKENIVGVINVYTVKKHNFSQDDINMLATAANQAAVAIENTELMVKTKIVQEELETRKRVEKAKGIIMKKHKLSEDEAFKLLRKSSMDKRVSMKEIAEAIILSAEIDRI
jgi:AmiR/NasT family two-component response regulator